MSNEMGSARIAELLRLVERDYDQTSEFIRSIVGTISTTRGWAVTVWLAVLGVAINQSSPPLAIFAGLLLLPFALLDAYHSWLYSEALKHARSIEKLSAAYYSAIEMGEDDEDLVLDFEGMIGSHRFGLYRNFRRFQMPEIKRARPTLVFRLFYPGLIASGFLAAGLLALFG
jgi:uncharacterized membrane protein